MNVVLLIAVIAAIVLAVLVPVLGIPALLGVVSVAFWLRRQKRFEQNRLNSTEGNSRP